MRRSAYFKIIFVIAGVIAVSLAVIKTQMLAKAPYPAPLAVSARAAYDNAAAYVLKNAKKPTVGYICGDWAVVGLKSGGAKVPKGYYETYRKNVADVLKKCKGVLSDSKYTEYSRVIIGLTAAGYDASAVKSGKTVYDLTAYLYDTKTVCAQGVNGAAFALIALDSSQYLDKATRCEYIAFILDKQLEDGGFNISGKGVADPDVTAITLRALSPYIAGDTDVSAACDKAVAALSHAIGSPDFQTAETIAQTILAMDALGIDTGDRRFLYKGDNLITLLLTFQNVDGGFCHAQQNGVNSKSDEMSTEQALMAVWGLETGD